MPGHYAAAAAQPEETVRATWTACSPQYSMGLNPGHPPLVSPGAVSDTLQPQGQDDVLYQKWPVSTVRPEKAAAQHNLPLTPST